MTRRTIFILLILSIAILIFGCSKKDGEIPDENKQGGAEMVLEQLKMPEAGEEIAIIKTNHGDIKVRLFPKIAPKAVENFKTHAKMVIMTV